MPGPIPASCIVRRDVHRCDVVISPPATGARVERASSARTGAQAAPCRRRAAVPSLPRLRAATLRVDPWSGRTQRGPRSPTCARRLCTRQRLVRPHNGGSSGSSGSEAGLKLNASSTSVTEADCCVRNGMHDACRNLRDDLGGIPADPRCSAAARADRGILPNPSAQPRRVPDRRGSSAARVPLSRALWRICARNLREPLEQILRARGRIHPHRQARASAGDAELAKISAVKRARR